MGCQNIILGLCLTRPPLNDGEGIFGFAEFLAALALLVLVFNSTDYLYRFRISVAPIPLFKVTFISTIVIGLGTILTDIWFAEGWLAPAWGLSKAILQGMFGGLFLINVLLWIWFAFIRPPVFSRWNYKRYQFTLYSTIVRGSDGQLPVISAEIARSARSLIKYVTDESSKKHATVSKDRKSNNTKVSDYAHDTLLMMGNRKLCRHIVASSPVTAIIFMQELSFRKNYTAPLGEFAKNITTEALLNKDSILYLESGATALDLLGMIQPFSKAMYGDYCLVNGLGLGRYSSLDLDWRVADMLDGDQFEAYCQIALITFQNMFDVDRYREHSTSIYRVFEIVAGGGGKVHLLNGVPETGELSVASLRLMAAVGFVDDAISFLADKKGLKFGTLRVRRDEVGYHQSTIFDQIAELAFDLIHHASYVKTPPELAWSIHYNTVWGRIFGLGRHGPAWRVIRFKLFRLLFDEIKEMERWPNYKGARILGFCLNVLGLSVGEKEINERCYPLRKAVLNWTRKNYLAIVEENPDIAEYCLSGGVTFDSENRRLVKTYMRGTNREAPREYLNLDEPR